MLDSWIQFLNHTGAVSWRFASQASLEVAILAVVVLLADALLRHRVRAALRYGLWMLVLLKLLLPPGLVSPTSIAYWLGPRLTPASAPAPAPLWRVRFSEVPSTVALQTEVPQATNLPKLTIPAYAFIAWILGAAVLALLMIRRHLQITQLLRQALPAPDRLKKLLQATAHELGITRVPDLRRVDEPLSPALCGFWRPVIVVPAHLEFSDSVWRTIFLHELTHLRRRDLGLNGLQAIAQSIWWWNPMVWWVNARIRQVRETAVDEAVMLATPHDNSVYPATLVQMARHCLAQPAWTLGFLGILTAPSRLELRVRRLLETPLPKTARLGWSGWSVLIGLTAILVPMGFTSRADTTKTARLSTTTPSAPEALHTRQFKVDSPMLLSLLSQNTAASIPAGEDVVQLQLNRFLAHNGLQFPQPEFGKTPSPAQPAVYFNRTNGMLFARATLTNLDRLEKVIQNLSPALHQIQVEARFIEGDLNAIAALNISGLTTNALKPGHTLLTETEADALLARLKATPGFEILTTPKVTTLSGRAAEISVVDIRTVVTGQSNTATGEAAFLTNSLPCGPTLQVTAWHDTALPGSLKMSTTARFVEFLGYQEAPTPTPLIRSNSVSADALLWDGQTHLLQMSPITNRVQFVDRVPLLSDVPIVGRLFRSSGSQVQVRQRLVLITPTLIDPTGQRLYDASRRPFDPATKP